MSSDAIETQLRSIYVESLRLDPATTALEGSGLLDRLDISSIVALEIMVGIEIRFDIELDIANFDVNALDSISALAEYLRPQVSRLGVL